MKVKAFLLSTRTETYNSAVLCSKHVSINKLLGHHLCPSSRQDVIWHKHFQQRAAPRPSQIQISARTILELKEMSKANNYNIAFIIINVDTFKTTIYWILCFCPCLLGCAFFFVLWLSTKQPRCLSSLIQKFLEESPVSLNWALRAVWICYPD